MSFWFALALGSGGAASMEVLKLYELFHKIGKRRLGNMVGSPMYWAVVLGMVLASGFVAWAFNADAKETAVWRVVLSGIAARSIVREAIAAKMAAASPTLGESPIKGLFS